VLLILGNEFVERIGDLDWRIFLYAMLSLTLARLLPVAIALLGMGLRRESVLFVGWFGPRGLASIVLGSLVLLNVSDTPHAETIALVVMTTVVLSVLLHGVSSIPLVVWYGRRAETFGPDAPENQPVAEMPVPMGWSRYIARTEQRLSGWETRFRRRKDGDRTNSAE
jgi:NhaP-type Na+/H+ or K+/H+ antiporter